MSFKSIILDSLETMRLGETARGERFKAMAYKKAMDGIRRMDGPVLKAADVKDVEGVGKKIYEKIQEIVETGGLKAAVRIKETTEVGAMEALLKVHGIGPVKAKELADKGIKTVEGLRDAYKADSSLLNETQHLGLHYYEAGIQRIPREEMDQHAVRLLAYLPQGLSGTIVGSYRRGNKDSGDVDMLVTYTGTAKVAQLAFQEYVSSMTKAGYIVDKLVSGPKKWMGYIQLPGGTPRRLDLLLTPPQEFPYALLYFTGSDRFNVAFRRHCLDMGYTLNEHGMKPKTGSEKPMPPNMETEKDIFDCVGLRYVAPSDRKDGSQIVKN